MARIKVSIINPSTLRLDERGDIGDTIDLHELQSVDNTLILEAIEKSKDEVYTRLIAQEIERQNNLKQIALKDQNEAFNRQLYALSTEKKTLENKIIEMTKGLEEQKKIALLELENKKNLELNRIVNEKERVILDLKNQVNAITEKQQLLIDKEKNEIQARFLAQINDKEKAMLDLKSQIERLKANEREELLKKEMEIRSLNEQLKAKEERLTLEVQKNAAELSQKYSEQITQKENEINQLKLTKSNLQVKMLGEELERWCNSEYETFALSGFEDCKWYKDNKAIKDNPDEKGTKADYIFEVYADKLKLDKSRLLTVVCEMKNESPDTKTKTKNSDHYKKLNDDRVKKNAQYALLVSELEWDTTNDSPIKKIPDYENMYMVRPTYFITFLSLIKSLANKYQALLLEQKISNETFMDSQEILTEFESFKTTYLDKPLESLLKDVEKIKVEADKAYQSSYKIMGLADTIISTKIAEIKLKIERFDIKKIARKVEKLDK